MELNPIAATARPITLLIAALGGEGGGVLADWIISAATAEDYPVQSTSIPGVAQRTGATTYYLEIYPVKHAALGGRRPVMTLTPSACDIDVMLASEWLEAGRAIMNGYVTRERTTLIASTHRIYTVLEKMQMGDGRYDSERVLRAANDCAKHTILADFEALAQRSGTLINAVLFGALSGSGALPLTRAACEAAIRAGSRGVEASLRGFALGYEIAAKTLPEALPAKAALDAQPAAKHATELAPFHPAARALLQEGARRVADYQDAGYQDLYFERMHAVAALEAQWKTAGELTRETARFLALWMCYEDVIRVADLKSRRSRFERVRAEVQAQPHEPVHIVEYLKPGLEEMAALLPPALSRRLLAWAAGKGLTHRFNVGLYVRTTGIGGFLLLRLLASLKPWRRRSAHYAEEQALIARWLAAIGAAGEGALAVEIAHCARLIKGYGDTNQRGKANFLRIMETLVESGAFADANARAAAVRSAREAALADAEGRSLEMTLAGHGIAPLPPKAKPLQFMRRPAAGKA